jgi:hypothetical protein
MKGCRLGQAVWKAVADGSTKSAANMNGKTYFNINLTGK